MLSPRDKPPPKIAMPGDFSTASSLLQINRSSEMEYITVRSHTAVRSTVKMEDSVSQDAFEGDAQLTLTLDSAPIARSFGAPAAALPNHA